MRREHTKTDSYIDWLKSIGCVLYLPLTQDGDLQDRISGASLQYTNNGREVYIKETLMFNKVLDLQTIRKIQGYE